MQKRFRLRQLDIPCVDVRDLGELRYHAINCMDVIEHVYDVEDVVADLLAHLLPGGRLFCWPSFYNSWNGDHVEKNCGYRGFFESMLDRVGLPVVDADRGGNILVCRRDRPQEGTVNQERQYIRRELYELSREYAWKSARGHLLALPRRLLHARFSAADPMERKIAYEQALSDIIDNVAIWRLSDHRLTFDLK